MGVVGIFGDYGGGKSAFLTKVIVEYYRRRDRVLELSRGIIAFASVF